MRTQRRSLLAPVCLLASSVVNIGAAEWVCEGQVFNQTTDAAPWR